MISLLEVKISIEMYQ